MMNTRDKALAELRDAVRKAGGLRFAKIGNRVEIYCGDNAPEVEKRLVAEAIRTGNTLQIGKEGLERWFEWVPTYRENQRGSGIYTWHKDGNRVKCELIECIRCEGGSVSRRVVRTGWRDFQKVME